MFDLSVGAIVSVAAVVACKVANSASPTIGLIAGVATGLGLGIANGIVIDRTRINSFIGTLATSIIYSGLAIVISGGLIVTVINPHFGSLEQGELFQITYPGSATLTYSVASQRAAVCATTSAVCSSEAMSTHSSAPWRPPASGP